jgi:hypothetical protein
MSIDVLLCGKLGCTFAVFAAQGNIQLAKMERTVVLICVVAARAAGVLARALSEVGVGHAGVECGGGGGTPVV